MHRQVFVPLTQSGFPTGCLLRENVDGFAEHVRGTRAGTELDADLPVYDMKTLESNWTRR